MKDSRTIDFYNKNAVQYFYDTFDADMSKYRNKFMKLLPVGGLVLDFGCGSGRDAIFFKKNGFSIDAVDGSKELCAIARENTGIPVKTMLFQDLDALEKYDGIWACSSILHLSKGELSIVFEKIYGALKPEGMFYSSFKYGDFEGEINGRYFTYFTEKTFEEFVKAFPKFKIIECSISADVRPQREKEEWLNIILKK